MGVCVCVCECISAHRLHVRASARGNSTWKYHKEFPMEIPRNPKNNAHCVIFISCLLEREQGGKVTRMLTYFKHCFWRSYKYN